MNAIDTWHALLRQNVELSHAYTEEFAASMRARKLTFGDRVHCPFLRPFFLSEADESRMRVAAETIAALGERVIVAALESPALFNQLGLTEAEVQLVRLDPGYERASTASRLDAFLLPESLRFAEYNAESPAGLGYTQRLCELFDEMPAMRTFRQGRRVRFNATIEPMLDALVASYREWGGAADPPTIAIVDWREVPTWSEFEILRDAFTARGVPTIVCDPRELAFENGTLACGGTRIDLVYRRVLINDILARSADCAALVKAYAQKAVCVANTFRCKLPHKKAFFAVLTDDRNAGLFSDEERAIIDAHVPWTRILADTETVVHGRRQRLMRLAEDHRESLVLKPNDEYGGTGVTLGWETSSSDWYAGLNTALNAPPGTWVLQERISVRREVFPMFDATGTVTMREMLVDFAPYLFRGRMTGYLTRLSSTGLANVTSGGGQVPSFVVAE
ncbi:MAG TPA: circularly permuted type 2 ATP-grasp protein [Vicinamibacterales bacterium]|nr:circularly permuted type 2 ATP-grasp protein [Vicinamibacterales bacterium]